MKNPLPETHCLALDSSLARNVLGWLPAWDTNTTIAETAAWYRQYYSNPSYRNPSAVRHLSMTQLETWRMALAEAKR
jgi:CDP-glucose 4,6-dehydratase